MNQTPEYYNKKEQEERHETFTNQPLPHYDRPF
jgi:hypothetical protein